MTIEFQLDQLKQKSIPHISKLRMAIESLTKANLDRFTDEEKRKQVREILRPATLAVMEFLRNYLSVEQAKVSLIRGEMLRSCEPPEGEFSEASLRELRDNLKQVPEKERMDLVRAGMNGRAGYLHAVLSDPGDALSEDVKDGLRREYLRAKDSGLLEKEIQAMNNFNLIKAMANELSSVAARLIDDSGFNFPLPLHERWISPSINSNEAMRRRFVENRHRTKISGIEPDEEE